MNPTEGKTVLFADLSIYIYIYIYIYHGCCKRLSVMFTVVEVHRCAWEEKEKGVLQKAVLMYVIDEHMRW